MTADRAAPPTDGQLRPAGSTVEGEAPGVDAHDADSTYPAMLAAKAAGDTLLADAYNVAFQMTISLDDLEHGVPSQAAISAHQALQSARGRNLDIGPIRLRKAAAKAAAAVADGGLDARLVDEAADILAMEPIRPEDWSALSQIEKDVLRSAELLDAAATDATEPK